jgi:DNA polymerase-3 subunit alpha
MAALLSSEMDNTDKVVKHINECREKKIEILPPDVNECFSDFAVTGNKIRFGLKAVKNVGQGAIESIVEARGEKGKFNSLFDFCDKIDLRKANKKVLESLIKCGAFDSFEVRRSQLMAALEEIVNAVQRIQKEKEKKQISMFQVIAESTGESQTEPVAYPEIPEWDQKERLLYEKECLGFYVTGHPLDNFRETLKTCTTIDTVAAAAATAEREVAIGGMVSAIKQITTKKGEPMGFVTFEDLSGFIEIIVFSDAYRQYAELLKSETPLLIKGRLSIESENNNRIIATEILALEKAHEISTPDIHMKCLINKLNHSEIDKIQNILKNNPGKSKVFLHVVIPDKSETVISLGNKYHTSASQLFVREIESVLGKNSVNFH